MACSDSLAMGGQEMTQGVCRWPSCGTIDLNNIIDAARDLDIDDIGDSGAADDDGAVHMQHVPPQISDNERQAVAERVDSVLKDAFKSMKRRAVQSSTLRPHKHTLDGLKTKHTCEESNRDFLGDVPALKKAPANWPMQQTIKMRSKSQCSKT